VAQAHFHVSGEGHRALEAWAVGFGPVARWGIEGASGLGRHTATYLCHTGHDVRDVCPNRTAERGRGRHQGKSDALDADRIAAETLTHPELPAAFKRAAGDTGPDHTREQLALWHKTRRSLVKLRQQLLGEAESLLGDLPEELRAELPDTTAVLPRLTALARRDHGRAWDATTTLRLRLLTPTPSCSPSWPPRSARRPARSASWSPRPGRPWASSSAWQPAASLSSWSRSAIPGASPRAASPASTAPPRSLPPPAKARANPCVTASTAAATVT
jgi:hypothetical protein